MRILMEENICKIGKEILISGMEHHSNIVPWQIVCEIYGAILKSSSKEQNGTISLEKFETLFSQKTNLVAMTIYPIRWVL
ncbi:MAG: aminotransferase class V-fold PLP-dependent enzyme [Bacteroidetes bacterium]|nr:aminotransferase class V-fold PLP-dependent enzyme [Bacteroidota bacterium]